MLPEEMGMGKYTFNLYARTKNQRCKSGFKRIKEKKKNHRIFGSPLQTQCRETLSYLAEDVLQHMWCSSLLYHLFKGKKPTWMISMIYSKIKSETLFFLSSYIQTLFQGFTPGDSSDHIGRRSDSI